MYDAADDPYTYENSTVLINELDLRDQAELDDFEASVGWAKARLRAVPTMIKQGLCWWEDGGHGARAPLPTLRSYSSPFFPSSRYAQHPSFGSDTIVSTPT
jgi:hypothetical protein